MLKTPRKYKTVAIPIKLWEEVSRVINSTGLYTNEAEFIREAIRSKLSEISIVETRNIPEDEIEDEIISYIREHGRAYPSDITADLGIPYFTALDVIQRLVEEGKLEPLRGG
ncbi:MAG: hypothetical protein ACE5Z5_01030 [Candidatus Bathyarchaeia archaeon]